VFQPIVTRDLNSLIRYWHHE